MPKDLTTKERNEIIGLAVDYDADSYNNFLNFVKESKHFNSSESSIVAALMSVSKIPQIELLDKFDSDDSDEFSYIRWGRIFLEIEPKKISLKLYNKEEKAKKAVAKQQ